MSEVIKGKYIHYKGNEYELLDVGVHTETEEEFVIYKSMRDPSKTWLRPKKMFFEEVDVSEYNYKGPRFKFVGE